MRGRSDEQFRPVITAGQLRDRVEIQSAVSSVDSVGEPISIWASFDTNVPARVRPLRGNELALRADKITSEVSIEITLRYRTDVTVIHRIVWNGRNWNIHSALPDEWKKSTQLLCSEVQ